MRRLIHLRRGIATLAILCCAGAPPTALAQSDEPPEILYRTGLQHFAGGNFAEAARFFQALLDRFGTEPELQKSLEAVYYAQGCCLYNLGQYKETIAAFQSYITKYPQAKFLDEAYFRSGAAYQALENYDEAVKQYREVYSRWPSSPFAEDAAYQIGACYAALKNTAEAVKAFEAFVKAFPDSTLAAQALVFLARAHFEANEPGRALDTLDLAARSTRNLDHLVYASFLAIEIGDKAFEDTDYDNALRAYRRVRTRQSLIRMVRGRAAALSAELEQMRKQTVAPEDLPAQFRVERRLRNALSTAQDALKKLEAMPDYDAGLFHRIGRCFYSVDRYWEARVAFTRVVAEAKDPVVREASHFDLVLTLNRLRRFPDLIAEADRYLAAFGEDKKLVESGRVPAVAFMRAESFINQELFEEAEREMKALLAKYPNHTQKARIEFYEALAIAMQERFDEAIAKFGAWLKKHPNDIAAAEVDYWMPVCMYYNGQYAEALPLLLRYVEEYPTSVYAPEAGYRAALCKYAQEDFESCGNDLAAWLQANPDHPFYWEALVTQGDAYAACGMLDEAKTAYLKVTAAAGPFYFLALQQVAKVYKALDTEKDYRQMAEVFGRYIQENPNAPNAVEAAYHAGWALRQIGQNDEARKLYWNTIERYGNNRTWEGFGPLLNDLRALYGGQTNVDLRSDVEAMASKARSAGRVTLLSRLALAQVRWRGAPPLEQAEEMARRFTMDSLDAEAMAYVGDAFIKGGQAERGNQFLDALLKEFPASRFTDVAYARKAEAAYAAGRFEEGLALAALALQKAQDPALFMEATFTQAQCLLALKQYDDALAAYNQVLANRATPRALKPQAMLGAAACHEAKGDFTKAIPYYQRVYVMYKAYTDAMATAYLKSAEAFERLKDRAAAINTYREMLAVETLAGRPELEQARARLEKLES